MALWLHGVLRQWRRHRFVMTLLILAYALGVGITTTTYILIAGRADAERNVAMGNPLRNVSAVVHIRNGAENHVPLNLSAWLGGFPVSWGWVTLEGRGEDLSPAFQQRSIFALFGDGPMDWSPPILSGRFLTEEDLKAGRPVIVVGADLEPEALGYTTIGITYDKAGEERGWDNKVFVPVQSLPVSVLQRIGPDFALHLQIADGYSVVEARELLEKNLSAAIPGARVMVLTGTDELSRIGHRFQAAYMRGFGLSGILLGLIAANVGALTVHWVVQRKREMGVRLAMGATVHGIVGMVLFENLLIGLAGAVGALPMIWVGTVLLPRAGMPVTVSWHMVGIVALSATLVSGLLSCIMPLRTLLKTPLRDSLRYQD